MYKCRCILWKFFDLKRILPILLLFGGWWFWRKYSTAQNLNWRITGAKFSKSPFGIKLTFFVENPTPSELTITGLFGDLFVNGVNAGRLISYDTQTISAQSTSEFTYVVKPTLSGSVAVVKQISKQGIKNLNVKFNGTIISSGVQLPIESSLTL